MANPPKEIFIGMDGVYMYPTLQKDDGAGHGSVRYIRGDVSDDLLDALQGMLQVYGYGARTESEAVKNAVAAVAKAAGAK